MKNIARLLRYDLPLHFIFLLTNWLPDMVVVLRLRGWLMRPFFGSCGKNFRIGRNVTFYNPRNIHIGRDVYIAYGTWFSAGEKIVLGDEVIVGPYCVFSSSNHTKENGSFRYGLPEQKPIEISKGSWIAAQCTVTAGSTVQEGVLIAANSVVKGNLKTDGMYAGSPVMEIKR